MKKGFDSKTIRFVKSSEFTIICIIVFLFFLFSITTDSFLTEYNLSNILKQSSIAGIIALAMTMVIVSGGIDLSVGSMAGLSALVTAMLMEKNTGMSIWAILPISILIGGLCGFINAVIIHELKLPPFIATLGTNQIFRALIKIVCQGRTVTGVYQSFSGFADSKLINYVPKLALVWIGVAMLIAFLMKRSVFGRNIYTIGCSSEVAVLSGVNLRKNMYGIYIASGLLCGLAGALLTGRINCAVPTGGSGYEMNAIAAAVIGGASLSGGKGSVIGTMLGSYLMVLLSNGGVQMGIDSFTMDITTGVLIILAVVFDQFKSKIKLD